MEKQQATPETLKLVWDEMVGNDRMRRYYSYLIKHYHGKNDSSLGWLKSFTSENQS